MPDERYADSALTAKSRFVLAKQSSLRRDRCDRRDGTCRSPEDPRQAGRGTVHARCVSAIRRSRAGGDTSRGLDCARTRRRGAGGRRTSGHRASRRTHRIGRTRRRQDRPGLPGRRYICRDHHWRTAHQSVRGSSGRGNGRGHSHRRVGRGLGAQPLSGVRGHS